MEFRLTREQLGDNLLYDTLKALVAGYEEMELPLYVVGASARDMAMRVLGLPKPERTTTDLDVAILLQDWSQYDRLSKILEDRYFQKDPAKQRFWYKGPNNENDYEVDVVPFGGVAKNEMVAWPPEGNPVMSVRCFVDVMRFADKVIVDDTFVVWMAPISGQLLIKLDAWLDRHLKKDTDASDMMYLLKNVYGAYVAVKEPLPREVNLEDADFDVIVAGAQWMAAELRTMLTIEHRLYYSEILEKELAQEESSALMQDLVRYSGDERHWSVLERAICELAKILRE